MKKILLAILTIFIISMSSYAIEYSLGASVGVSPAYLRGSDELYYSSVAEILSGDNDPYRFGYVPSVNFMIEPLAFLAIETGVAWETIFISYSGMSNISFNKSQISIPISLRGQYEYKLGVTYASVGLKFGIPLSQYFLDDSSRYSSIFSESSISIENSSFSMDVIFAIGQEFRLGDANYLGIRVSYDLNVVSSINKEQFSSIGLDTPSLFIDNINFSITYRYAFKSKWKQS